MAKYNRQTVETICSYIRDGDSKKLACKRAGIGESTFYEWMQGKTEFAESIKKAEAEFTATITGKLEASLWKRATGYEVTETETEYFTDKEGNQRIKSQKIKTKHIQPDTGALIFALTNVAPDKWKNKQDSSVDITGGLQSKLEIKLVGDNEGISNSESEIMEREGLKEE